MLRGIYTSASGMIAQEHNLDAIANNLANADTTSYKRDVSIGKSFPEMLIRRMNDDGLYKFPIGSIEFAPLVGALGTGVEQNEVFTIFEQGSLKATDSPFDVALQGEGFFVVETAQGGEVYTRNGSFVLGKEGFLETKEGFRVLGHNGPIQVKENNFTIKDNGEIYHNADLAGDPREVVSLIQNDWASTEMFNKFRIVHFEEPRYLAKTGSSFYKETEHSGKAEELAEALRPKITQGYIEASNVNPIQEMVRMIEANRAYEANQKNILNQDEMLAQLINEVRKLM